MELAKRFEGDPTFRRTCLEESLVNKGNGYSKVRLAHYNQKDWESLPVAAFRSRPIVPEDLGKPVPSPNATWSTIPKGAVSDSEQGLRQRGEQMFRYFPAQLERSLVPILRDKQGPPRYGLWATAESVGGLVWVALPGGVFPSLTCSSCHSSVDANGTLRPGVPNHQIDLGKARDDYTSARTFFSTWGPGRVNLTAEDKEHPVVIADVRAVRFEPFLHRTANIKNSLTALALRVETGLIGAHYNTVRPSRSDAFSLAYYLWTLGEQFDPEAAMHHRGRALFERHCARCHTGKAHAGAPVLPETVQSPVAEMPGAARGTGKVQSISLVGVSKRGRLLFGGQARSIDQFLDPTRETGGHYVGRNLLDTERLVIKEYLEQL